MRILTGIVLTSILIAMIACTKKNTNPDQCFSAQQQTDLIRQCVYYSAKNPPGATKQTKFDTEFDEYYAIAASEYDFRACAAIDDNDYYFLMTRKARSIWPAREAIGGRINVDEQGKIIHYEEVFRTWKMAEDSLGSRATELFNLMIDGKDLTPYRSRYKGDRYIELPDDRFYFNKEKMGWSDRIVDSLKLIE